MRRVEKKMKNEVRVLILEELRTPFFFLTIQKKKKSFF